MNLWGHFLFITLMNLVDGSWKIYLSTDVDLLITESDNISSPIIHGYEIADLHGASRERLMNVTYEGSCLRIQILLRPALNFSRKDQSLTKLFLQQNIISNKDANNYNMQIYSKRTKTSNIYLE